MRQKKQHGRIVLVALLALRVENCGVVPEQAKLSSLETHPVHRMRPDVVEGAPRPVARHLARRQWASGRARGEFHGVGLFVLRRATARAQRYVGAVGACLVADEEVGSRLRSGQMKLSSDD